MPITTDALQVGLEAGVKIYDVQALGWTPNLQSGITAQYLAIAAFDNENFYAVPDGGQHHSSDPSTPDAIQNPIMFKYPIVVNSTKIKSYLDDSVVLPITKTTTIRAIAFALCTSNNCKLQNFNPTAKTWGAEHVEETNYNYSIDADIPPKFTGSTPPNQNDCFQDLFMVIPVNIPVTAGGFLTIKGGDANFTYITLESTT